MVEQPLISVLIPLYNSQAYIADCLESIVHQTHRNLEIIIVNDGSTDSSPDICQQYAQRDSRIKLIHQENKGLAETRNTGLNHMTGDFFTFFDNDDLMLPDYIATMYGEMADDVDMVCMNFKDVAEDITYDQVKNSHYDNQGILTFEGDDSFKELAYMEIFKVSSHGKLFRSSTLGAIRYTSFFNEDLGNTYQYFLKARQVVKIERVGYFYRLSSGGMSRSKFTKEREDDDLAANMLANISDVTLHPYANLLLFLNFSYIYKEQVNLFYPFRKKLRKRIAELAKGTSELERPSRRLAEYQKHPRYSLEKRVIKRYLGPIRR